MDTNLKVYVCDLDWMGRIVVISDSVENARKLMERFDNYRFNVKGDSLPSVCEYEIVEGIVHCDYGDT